MATPQQVADLDALRSAYLVQKYGQARQAKGTHDAWQTLGAFADARRTGMSGAQARDMREAPKTWMTATEKMEAQAPIVRQLETAKREWGKMSLDQTMALFREQNEGTQTAIRELNDAQQVAGQVSAQVAGQTVAFSDDVTKRGQERRAQMLEMSPDARKAVEAALDPKGSPEVSRRIEEMAQERAEEEYGVKWRLLEDGSEMPYKVDRDGNEQDLTAEDKRRLEADTEQLIPKITRGVLEGDIVDAEANAAIQNHATGRISALQQALLNAPKDSPGEAAKILDAFTLASGLSPQDIEARLDPGFVEMVQLDVERREKALQMDFANETQALNDAEARLARAGVNTTPVKAAIENYKAQLARGLSDITGSDLPEDAGLPGEAGAGVSAGPSAEAVLAPSGTPVQGQGAGQGPGGTSAQGAPDPRVRSWQALGYQGPPPGSGIEYLEGYLKRIEEFPELPAVQLAQQNILQSKQFKDWKTRNGYVTDSPHVFRQFVRETRASIDQFKRQELQNTARREAAGDIPMGARPLGAQVSNAFRKPKAEPPAAPAVVDPEAPAKPQEPAAVPPVR